MQAGDAAPASSIGINLPNSDWIRKDYGSKSVSLSNIIYSYNVMNARKGTLDEFAANDEIKMRIKNTVHLPATYIQICMNVLDMPVDKSILEFRQQIKL